MAGGGEDRTGGDGVSLIFVYGTLKRGFYNHRLIEDLIRSRDVSYVHRPPHHRRSISIGVRAPRCPIPNQHSWIWLPLQGELYSVSSGSGRARLDELEGVNRGHYERLPVAVVAAEGRGSEKVVEVEAYFAHREFGEALWKKCGEEGLSEYSVDMGKKYVRREDRPPHSNFIHDIRKFISEGN